MNNNGVVPSGYDENVVNRRRSEWSKQSACNEYPRLFTGEETKERVEIANNICKSCPVLTECFNYAVVHEMQGIWAGTTTSQRKYHQKDQTLPAFVLRVPHIEPEFQDFLKHKESEPHVYQKPATLKLPDTAPDLIEKVPVGDIPQRKKLLSRQSKGTSKKKALRPPATLMDTLDQLLPELLLFSSPAKPEVG